MPRTRIHSAAGRYPEAGVALSKRLIVEPSEVFAHRAALEFI